MEQSVYMRFYNEEAPERWGRHEMSQELAITLDWLTRSGCHQPRSVVLELGCGMGALSSIHSNYIGVDLSHSALRRFDREVSRINASMEAVPLKNDSVDFVFSWAALEHVPHPEHVLLEIERVLRPGGVAFLAPAWNVRSWAAKALPVRKYQELNYADRFSKAMIPLRNSILWRAMAAVPRRVKREVTLIRKRPVRFDYSKLKPTMDRYEYTDCDAFSSMDAHAAICYFLSRKWQILSHSSVGSRLSVRHEPVVVRKPQLES